MLPILHQSYWRDEAFSVLLASKSLKEIFFLTAKDVNPPFYYFLLHFWIKLFGDAEFITRSFSLLFLFLLALSSFFLLRQLIKDWRISLLGSLAILLNPFLFEYGFEARSYVLFGFLTVTAILFYLKRKYLLSSLFLGLMVFTHNFGVFFLIALLAFWFFENRENLKKRILHFSSLFIFPILVFLGWLQMFWNQWTKVAEGFWIGPVTSTVFVDTFRFFFRGTKDYPSVAMFYNITLLLVFLACAYWIVKLANKEDENDSFNKDASLILVFLFSIPFLIAYFISAFWIPILHERYLIPILPFFIIWVTFSLYQLFSFKKIFSNIVLVLAVGYLFFAVQSAEEIVRKTSKPAINYAAGQITAIAGKNDVVIPESNLNFLETKYYIQKKRSDVPIYAYSADGKIPFYIGDVLFEENEIIKEYPKDKQIWIVTPDGGYYLKEVVKTD